MGQEWRGVEKRKRKSKISIIWLFLGFGLILFFFGRGFKSDSEKIHCKNLSNFQWGIIVLDFWEEFFEKKGVK